MNDDFDEMPTFQKTRKRREATKYSARQQWRMCGSKARYENEGRARQIIRGRGVEGLRPYCCPICKGWHITHNNRNTKTDRAVKL